MQRHLAHLFLLGELLGWPKEAVQRQLFGPLLVWEWDDGTHSREAAMVVATQQLIRAHELLDLLDTVRQLGVHPGEVEVAEAPID